MKLKLIVDTRGPAAVGPYNWDCCFHLVDAATGEELEGVTGFTLSGDMDNVLTLNIDVINVAAEVNANVERESPPSAAVPARTVRRDHFNSGGEIHLDRLVLELGLARSTLEARQSIEIGAVRFGSSSTPLTDPDALIRVVDGMVLHVGRASAGVVLG